MPEIGMVSPVEQTARMMEVIKTQNQMSLELAKKMIRLEYSVPAPSQEPGKGSNIDVYA